MTWKCQEGAPFLSWQAFWVSRSLTLSIHSSIHFLPLVWQKKIFFLLSPATSYLSFLQSERNGEKEKEGKEDLINSLHSFHCKYITKSEARNKMEQSGLVWLILPFQRKSLSLQKSWIGWLVAAFSTCFAWLVECSGMKKEEPNQIQKAAYAAHVHIYG